MGQPAREYCKASCDIRDSLTLGVVNQSDFAVHLLLDSDGELESNTRNGQAYQVEVNQTKI